MWDVHKCLLLLRSAPKEKKLSNLCKKMRNIQNRLIRNLITYIFHNGYKWIPSLKKLASTLPIGTTCLMTCWFLLFLVRRSPNFFWAIPSYLRHEWCVRVSWFVSSCSYFISSPFPFHHLPASFLARTFPRNIIFSCYPQLHRNSQSDWSLSIHQNHQDDIAN